jgi:hypothetical protein
VDLYEYQAKELFAAHGVPAPADMVATTVGAAVAAAEELGTPVMVKSQVKIGGRGKAGGVKFAPVGVVDMLNCGGTIVDVEGHGDVRVRVKGAGNLVVYSSVRPARSLVDGCDVAFEWGNGGKLEVSVAWKQDKEGVCDVVFCF